MSDDPCRDCAGNTILQQRLRSMCAEMSEMKTSLREMAKAITQLAVVEERQAQTSSAVDRAYLVIERLENRITGLEMRVPINEKSNQWIDKVTWAGLGLMGMYFAKSAGLL